MKNCIYNISADVTMVASKNPELAELGRAALREINCPKRGGYMPVYSGRRRTQRNWRWRRTFKRTCPIKKKKRT